MENELKKLFPSFTYYNEEHLDTKKDYQWFITEKNDIIGIAKSELTARDMKLISTFLPTYNIHIPIPTELELWWRETIRKGSNKKISPFRFVFFQIKKDQIEPEQFKAAIDDFYSKGVPILWENEYQGVIIEESLQYGEEAISYDQIIDVLMSDLYSRIRFFVGPFMDSLQEINSFYTSFIKHAEMALSHSDSAVISYSEAIIYHFINKADPEFINEASKIILKEFLMDEELLHTIKVFISCNLNVSVAAKKLHLHRNSLQYRLDKFIDKTGIDIRKFHEAVVVYLILLAKVHKN
ncbi:hypothetical protein D8M04_08960 [Oceanobacillus piezotolerans]|uniref:PucR C-terminal helix-turn-helix domain-containing protein n=1 Tax=Oceanobacillus piezotolerans TaxID=2448030 RepID=A0A498DDD6_9BACI|nr:helix-turn-helix domain-containing protein [Oceanobacillus piezotolerans]RLL44994.1 hypothetical protein D8M04_08960 [Oceanobacillus piezotolerans]